MRHSDDGNSELTHVTQLFQSTIIQVKQQYEHGIFLFLQALDIIIRHSIASMPNVVPRGTAAYPNSCVSLDSRIQHRVPLSIGKGAVVRHGPGSQAMTHITLSRDQKHFGTCELILIASLIPPHHLFFDFIFSLSYIFLQAAEGFRAIVSHGVSGLTMSMDMTATAFVSRQNLLDYMALLLFKPREGKDRFASPLSGVSQSVRREAFSKIKGLEVEMRSFEEQAGRPRKRIISGFSRLNANEYTFVLRTGVETSITEYFLRKYNYVLKFPLVPVIEIARNTYVPAELLT